MKILDGWLIYTRESSQRNNISINWFIEEGKRIGLNMDLFIMEKFQTLMKNNTLKIVYDDMEISLPRFALFRGYNYILAKQLEVLGVRVFNSSRAMELSLDKVYTHQKLSMHGIDMPDTIFESDNDMNTDYISSILEYPMVVKASKGKGGDQVYLVNNNEELVGRIEELRSKGYRILFQKYISSSHGKDIRAFVVGERVIGAVVRMAKEGFKANYSQGGSCKSIELSNEVSNIAIKSSRLLGLDIAGVDLLFTDNGVTLCEVNANPAFKTIYNTSTVNVPAKIMEHIKNKLEVEGSKMKGKTN